MWREATQTQRVGGPKPLRSVSGTLTLGGPGRTRQDGPAGLHPPPSGVRAALETLMCEFPVCIQKPKLGVNTPQDTDVKPKTASTIMEGQRETGTQEWCWEATARKAAGKVTGYVVTEAQGRELRRKICETVLQEPSQQAIISFCSSKKKKKKKMPHAQNSQGSTDLKHFIITWVTFVGRLKRMFGFRKYFCSSVCDPCSFCGHWYSFSKLKKIRQSVLDFLFS